MGVGLRQGKGDAARFNTDNWTCPGLAVSPGFAIRHWELFCARFAARSADLGGVAPGLGLAYSFVATGLTVVFIVCGFVNGLDFHCFAVSLIPSDEVGAPVARSLAPLDKTWRLIAGPCGQV